MAADAILPARRGDIHALSGPPATLLQPRRHHARFGQVLKAIRENKARAISPGYRITLAVFVLLAALFGLAGAMSGRGTIFGPLPGDMAIFGVAVLLFREGIVSCPL